ncbi:ABC transporter substrate-binding protein [Amedibacillus sp. YH-ame10]
MKKMLTLLVAGLMTVSMTACGGSSNEDRALIIGSDKFSQAFLNSEALGNSSYDKNIRDMIYGYETFAVDSTGEFKLNETAIKKLDSKANDDGSKTFTFTINDKLLFSDGSELTADDYLFHVMIAASPEFADNGDPTGEYYAGYKTYHDGSSKAFSGLNKIDDKTFSVTVDKSILPYFWENSLVVIRPDSMKTIAGKDAKLEQTEEGLVFHGDMAKAVETWVGKENKTPSVSSGPYKFVSYKNGQVKLTINDKFAGDPRGNKPTIKEVIVKEINMDTDMDTFLNKEIDVLNDVIEGDKIDKGLKDDKSQSANYDRNGYGTFAFKCNFGPTKEVEVRRALNFIVDKDELVKTVTGGYGVTLNSEYSTAQWVYAKTKDDLESSLKYIYAYSLDKANAELDASSYRFEADGVTPFDANKASADYLRYNANKEVLQINHMGTENNSVTDNLELLLTQNAPKVGIKFTLTRTDFDGLMKNYYFDTELKEEEKIYHTFNLGSNYSDAPDPYYASFSSDYVNSTANAYRIADPKMDELIQDLRHTEPTDRDGFEKKWLAYEVYYNELLPMAPLYANTYYNFASKDLKGFEPNSFQTVYQTISALSWK